MDHLPSAAGAQPEDEEVGQKGDQTSASDAEASAVPAIDSQDAETPRSEAGTETRAMAGDDVGLEFRREAARPAPSIHDFPPAERADALVDSSPTAPPPLLYAMPAPSDPEPQSRGRSWSQWMSPMLGGLVGAILTVAALWLFGVFEDPVPVQPPASSAGQIVEQPAIRIDGSSDLVAAIASQAVPSIVTIEIGTSRNADGETTFFRDASGSGVVYTNDGYIITNNHVIEGSIDIRVILSDGRVYEAAIIGTDPLTDLAVVRIDASDLAPITSGDPGTIDIGELAVAVGNPLGLRGGPSVTSGIVSALGRSLDVGGTAEVLYGLVQTDAPITRGSSGGALLNEIGELIGITTAIGTSGIAAEGLGFAVPIDMVDKVASNLIADGSVDHAFLGLFGSPAFTERSDGSLIPVGARIESFVSDDSAIRIAGAQSGDIITAIGGVPITEMDQLVAQLRTKYRASESVSLTIVRGEAQEELSVTLDRHPGSS